MRLFWCNTNHNHANGITFFVTVVRKRQIWRVPGKLRTKKVAKMVWPKFNYQILKQSELKLFLIVVERAKRAIPLSTLAEITTLLLSDIALLGSKK